MLIEKSLVGLKLAFIPEYVTVPVTGVTPWLIVNVVEVIVDTSINLLKFAVTVLLRTTSTSLSSGSVEIIEGEWVSPVLKVHT